MTEDAVVGWHVQLNGHGFEQTQEDSEGQGSLTYCSPWGHKKSDMTVTEQLYIYIYMCVCVCMYVCMGFPCGSVGKESACNMGDLGSIPGLGRSPGEGKGYLLRYSGLENSMD